MRVLRSASARWTFMSTSSLKCEADIEIDDSSLDGNAALSLYRVLQESLTNIARHADATMVNIRLEEHKEHVLLEVSDDGRGIRAEDISSPDSYGLIGMQERVNLLKGRIEIKGDKGMGTTVHVTIPTGNGA